MATVVPSNIDLLIEGEILENEEKSVLEPLQEDRLEALVTALVGVEGQSELSHAVELIDFLQQNFEVEASAYAVAKASYHQRLFGETPGTRQLLDWASEHLSHFDFNLAKNFFFE